MGITWHQGTIFSSGFAYGVLASALVVLVGLHAPAARDKPQARMPAPAGVAVPSHQIAGCPLQSATVAADEKDGRFNMPAELYGYAGPDSRAFIAIGKEAAAEGRRRDAEIALLMSCRVADRVRGSGSLEAADARYQLGRHYDSLARQADPAVAADPSELLRRAQLLYSDSLRIYAAAYGEEHEKARAAAEGLAGLRERLAGARETVVAQATMAQAVEAARPGPERASAHPRATPAKPQPRKVEAKPKPDLGCAGARSVTEKMICSDAELARMDREVGYLHARARVSTHDTWTFKRQDDEELRRRESTCRDRRCLLQWYAHRRSRLLNDIHSG